MGALQHCDMDLWCICVSFLYYATQVYKYCPCSLPSQYSDIVCLVTLWLKTNHNKHVIALSDYTCVFRFLSRQNWWENCEAHEPPVLTPGSIFQYFISIYLSTTSRTFCFGLYVCKRRKAELSTDVSTHEGASSLSMLGGEEMWTVKFERPALTGSSCALDLDGLT